jgi:hypothetical protein
METLKGKLVRLAYGKPELRADLLPLLKQARYDWKKTLNGTKVRVRWSDHPDNTVLIEELPGKPVKRRVRRMLTDNRYLTHWVKASSSFLMANIMRDFKFSKGMSYDQAVASLRGAMEKAKADAIDETAKAVEKNPGRYELIDDAWFKKMGWPRAFFQENEVSYLEVEPVDYKPVSFKGKGFSGKAEWTKFEFWDEKSKDEYMEQMEGMRAFYSNKSAGGARKLFKWLKANEDKVKNMDVGQFQAMLDKGKIAYKYVPTVWR